MMVSIVCKGEGERSYIVVNNYKCIQVEMWYSLSLFSSISRFLVMTWLFKIHGCRCQILAGIWQGYYGDIVMTTWKVGPVCNLLVNRKFLKQRNFILGKLVPKHFYLMFVSHHKLRNYLSTIWLHHINQSIRTCLLIEVKFMKFVIKVKFLWNCKYNSS